MSLTVILWCLASSLLLWILTAYAAGQVFSW
jgi:hypothetical protein